MVFFFSYKMKLKNILTVQNILFTDKKQQILTSEKLEPLTIW